MAMNKIIGIITFLTFSAFSVISCTKDDSIYTDNMLTINGVDYNTSVAISTQGQWNKNTNKAKFTVATGDRIGSTMGILLYNFNFTTNKRIAAGDKLHEMELSLCPITNANRLESDTDIAYDYKYVSGSAVVLEANSAHDFIRIDFNKLVMEYNGDLIELDGVAKVDFCFSSVCDFD